MAIAFLLGAVPCAILAVVAYGFSVMTAWQAVGFYFTTSVVVGAAMILRVVIVDFLPWLKVRPREQRDKTEKGRD